MARWAGLLHRRRARLGAVWRRGTDRSASDRVMQWAFDHFPVPEHGEWTMRLTREGERPEGLLSLIPLPPQFGQVLIGVPGLARLPWQVEQSSVRGTLIVVSFPKAASSNSIRRS